MHLKSALNKTVEQIMNKLVVLGGVIAIAFALGWASHRSTDQITRYSGALIECYFVPAGGYTGSLDGNFNCATQIGGGAPQWYTITINQLTNTVAYTSFDPRIDTTYKWSMSYFDGCKIANSKNFLCTTSSKYGNDPTVFTHTNAMFHGKYYEDITITNAPGTTDEVDGDSGTMSVQGIPYYLLRWHLIDVNTAVSLSEHL